MRPCSPAARFRRPWCERNCGLGWVWREGAASWTVARAALWHIARAEHLHAARAALWHIARAALWHIARAARSTLGGRVGRRAVGQVCGAAGLDRARVVCGVVQVDARRGGSL